jgi:hypothetical protein
MSLEVILNCSYLSSAHLMLKQARDAVDPLSALRFWSDEQEGNREVENYVSEPLVPDILVTSVLTSYMKINRFARRSRALHRLDIIGDDVSSLASSSIASSSASTTSNSTASPPQSAPIHSPADPFSNPPSYRSGNSVSGNSARSVSTTSTLASHLANQRRPPQARPQPPPLLSSQGVSTINPTSRVGSDGRTRLVRRSDAASSTNATATTRESGDGSQTGSSGSGRRLSRRASFFALLRNTRT